MSSFIKKVTVCLFFCCVMITRCDAFHDSNLNFYINLSLCDFNFVARKTEHWRDWILRPNWLFVYLVDLAVELIAVVV